MSTLIEIENAAKKLPPDERQRLLIALAQSLRASGQTLPDPREFEVSEMTSWMDEDENDLKRLRREAESQ